MSLTFQESFRKLVVGGKDTEGIYFTCVGCDHTEHYEHNPDRCWDFSSTLRTDDSICQWSQTDIINTAATDTSKCPVSWRCPRVTSFSWSRSCRTVSCSVSSSSNLCFSCCFSSSTASPYSAAWIFSRVVSQSSRERRSTSARSHCGPASVTSTPSGYSRSSMVVAGSTRNCNGTQPSPALAGAGAAGGKTTEATNHCVLCWPRIVGT